MRVKTKVENKDEAKMRRTKQFPERSKKARQPVRKNEDGEKVKNDKTEKENSIKQDS